MKKLFLAMIICLMAAVLVSSVFAATATLRRPLASGKIAGNYRFNITTGVTYAKNCTLTGTSTLQGQTVTIILKNTTVGVAQNNYLNKTNTTALFYDSNDWSFTGNCKNATQSATITAVASVTIDNTDPTAPSALSPSTTQTDGSFSASATVTDAETTACTLVFTGTNPGSKTYTMTHSGTSCTYSFTNVPEATYKFYVTASDETNTTDSAEQEFVVDIGSGNAVYKAQMLSGSGAVGKPLSVTTSSSTKTVSPTVIKTVGLTGAGLLIGFFVFAGFLGPIFGPIVGAVLGYLLSTMI